MRDLIALSFLSLASCSADPSTSNITQHADVIDNHIATPIKLERLSSGNAKLQPIGGASMDRHGTITLQLSTEEKIGIAEATLIYKKSDKNYKYILKHIGPIRPGEGKLVYPFPRNDDSDEGALRKNH